MYDIELKFEEVALCIGNNGKRQSIGLISGTALITVRAQRWQIESVDLDPPITTNNGITIDHRHPLFGFVVESIGYDCGDRIWDEVLELNRPDPDHHYKLARADG